MIGILRWFLGWSEFKIEGNINDFLSNFKTNVWSVRKRGKFILARCMTRDYFVLSEKSLEFGSVLTKIRDFGFLNFLKKYKFRFGLFIGILFFFIVIFISNLFIWDIEIFGNAIVTDEQIFKVCDENGLHFGSSVFSVNEQDIEHKIKEKYPEISWISLNRIAGKYIIEVSESKKKPEIVEWEGPSNVIATYDGEILYVEAYSGNPIVNVGDFVKKGQVLVSCIQELKGADNLAYSHADAKIIAKVNRYNKIEIKKDSVIDQKTGVQVTENRLVLFGIKIPIKINKKRKNVVKTREVYKPLEFLGIRFPILMQTSFYDVYEKIYLKGDKNLFKKILLEKQKDWEIKELMGNKILERKYTFEENDDVFILDARVDVEQRIDKKVPVNEKFLEGKEKEWEKRKYEEF